MMNNYPIYIYIHQRVNDWFGSLVYPIRSYKILSSPFLSIRWITHPYHLRVKVTLGYNYIGGGEDKDNVGHHTFNISLPPSFLQCLLIYELD